MSKGYSGREFKKLLNRNGYYKIRSNGSHTVYENTIKHDKITANENINKMVAQRLIKEHGLIP